MVHTPVVIIECLKSRGFCSNHIPRLTRSGNQRSVCGTKEEEQGSEVKISPLGGIRTLRTLLYRILRPTRVRIQRSVCGTKEEEQGSKAEFSPSGGNGVYGLCSDD